jgi:hypothetical protein
MFTSFSSFLRKLLKKKQLYQDAGVLEYWLIDPLQRRTEFYRLYGNRYELVPLEVVHEVTTERSERKRIFRSTAMEGFWLDVVEWLFAEPLPKSYEILQKMLGNPY